MDSLQIFHALKPILGDACLGVFPCDKIPLKPLSPCGFIVNTDPSNRPGSHWIAIFIQNDNNIEYFDSYGRKPTGLILKWFKKHKKRWINSQRIQGSFSSVCGHYSIYFLVKRWKGCLPNQVLKPFNKDFEENDQMITDWVNDSFDCDTQT
jgi:hypothetical protein